MTRKKTEKSLEQMLKDSLVKEDDQPYSVLANWVWAQLNIIGNYINGKAFKPSEWSNHGRPIVRIQNLNNARAPYNYCNFNVPKKYQIQDGELLFAWSGTPGTSFGAHIWNGGRAVLNQHIFRVEHDNYIIDKLFFKYALNQVVDDFIRNAHGTAGLAHITKKKFENSYIPLPPLPEQKRIVIKLSAMLGKLNEARKLIREAKETFEERRAAILNKAFTGELTKKWRDENPDVKTISTENDEIENKPYKIPSNWKWVKLKDVCNKFQYGTSAKSKKVGKIPVIRMGNIQNGRVVWDNLVYTSDYKEIEQYSLNYNDLLFNRTNSPALVGKTAIYKSEMPAIFAGYLIRINPQDELDADYLNFFLNSPYARFKCNRVKTDGVSQSNINSKKLGRFEIPLSPLSEQKEIVRILDNLLTHEDEAKALIDMEEQIDLLEKSILSKAFRGELGTNDPSDEPAIELLKRSLKEKINS